LSDGHQIDNPKIATNKKTKRTLKIRQRRISRKQKNSKNQKKANKRVGRLHKKIADKRKARHWKYANEVVSRNVDAFGVEALNVSVMRRRCKVKKDENTGRLLENGQSRKRGLNRSIADAGWSELVLKIEYLAEKQGKVVIKINPKNSSIECRKCGHIDKSNRDREKFICVNCGHFEHADIGASKTIRDRAYELVKETKVCGDSAKPSSTNAAERPKNRKETSPRRQGKRGEPLCSQNLRQSLKLGYKRI
jgi:putative transposase